MSPVGGGFAVALATLMIERYVATDSAGFGPHLDLFVDLAKEVRLNGRPAIEDGRIRQQIARNYAMRAGLDSINRRARLMMQAGMTPGPAGRSEEHTYELQSLMRISYAVFCLKKTTTHNATDDGMHTMTKTHPNQTAPTT